LWISEPVFVAEPHYAYRTHDANTIKESGTAAKEEADIILGEYLQRGLREHNDTSAFAPSLANWGVEFLASALGNGLGGLMDVAALQRIAQGHLEDVFAHD
jgi:hypothetical protein